MSQVDTVGQAETVKRSKASGLKERVEGFLRHFEWTWTNAVAFCLALVFFVLVTSSVIPSFWLYFADQKLKWDGSGPNGFWLKELRDAVAMGLVTGPFITVLVVATILQNWRHKLRGSGGDSRPSGGYR
jgi:ABC-type Fe3+ transport system permease subunit